MSSSRRKSNKPLKSSPSFHPFTISWTNPNDDHYNRRIKIDTTKIKEENELQIIQNEEINVEGVNYRSRFEVPPTNEFLKPKRQRDDEEIDELNSKKPKIIKIDENVTDDDDEGRLVIKEEEELIIIEENVEEIATKSKQNYSSDNSTSSNTSTTSSHTCKICQKSFRRKIDLIHHRHIHEEAKHECMKCGQKFKSVAYFNKHECNTCTICNRNFTSKQQLKAHRRLIHTDDLASSMFQCDICGKEFKYRHGVIYHMTVEHIKDLKVNYDCDICGKKFNMKEKVRLHLKHHASLIKCNLCGKHLRAINLGHHMKYVHTNERNFQCQLCNLSFKTRECVKSHMRTHEKNYQCGFCGKKFPSQYILNEHKVLHRNPDELTCKTCKKTFAQKYCLKAHMKLHEKLNFEKFKCGLCPYSTENGENYKKHELKHKRKEENEKLTKNWVQCKKCKMKLKNKLKLATHYWKKHNVAPE